MDTIEHCVEAFAKLQPFDKLVEYSRALVFQGEYAALATRPPAPVFILDNVNFSRSFTDDPLPFGDIVGKFDLEPGYGTITGDFELGPLLREWAVQRVCDAGAPVATARRVVDGTVAITAAGATGAAFSLLSAMRARALELPSEHQRDELVFNAPCYPIPDGIARQLGLVPVPVHGTADHGFLPCLNQIGEAVGLGTLACFLTFPTNPSMESWRADDPAFARLVTRCQERGVWLIADPVFAELHWSGPAAPELFAVTDSADYLAVVHSPSKDRPFAAGLRVGHALVDARLGPWLLRSKGVTENSIPTLQQVWLALDVLLRVALGRGQFAVEMCDLVDGRFLYGFGAPIVHPCELHRRIVDAGWFERYAHRLTDFRHAMRRDLARVHAALSTSAVFASLPLPSFGNLLLARVQPPFDRDGEDRFCLETMAETGVATTVGGCFGLRDEGTWIRIAVGGAPAEQILSAIAKVEDYWRAT